MRILQVIAHRLDGSVVHLLGANHAVLIISKDEVAKLSLPGVVEGDSSVAYVTNLVTAENNECIFAAFDDKLVSKWNLTTRSFGGSVPMKKKANSIARGTVQEKDIVIIGDKVGDIWGFESQNMNNLGYLGGHPVTIITEVAINQDSTVLASSDRDEKIKISSFPLVEEIRGYLLAHKSVVTSIAFVDKEGQYLVSVGWDHKIILWNTISCTPIDVISFNESDSNEIAGASEAKSSATPLGDGEDGEKERDYNEALAGNYPFKVAVSSNGLVAVLCKNEKKVTILRATTTTSSQSLELMSSFALPAQPVDLAFISETELSVVLPHPYYLRVFSIGIDATAQDVTSSKLSSSVIESLHSLLGESFSSSVLFKSLGFEDDRSKFITIWKHRLFLTNFLFFVGLMRDQLENPIRELPKGGYVPNKKSRK